MHNSLLCCYRCERESVSQIKYIHILITVHRYCILYVEKFYYIYLSFAVKVLGVFELTVCLSILILTF